MEVILKSLIKFFKGYVKESILGPLFKLLEATLELIVPLVIANIVDYGILKSDKPHVVKMSLILVALGAVGLIFSVIAQYYAAKASVGFVTKIRTSLFEKIQTLSYSDIDTLGTSTLITRMTADTSKVQTGLNLGLRLLLRSPFVVFGAMIMAYTVSPAGTKSFALAILLLSVVVFGIMLITMPLYKRVQKGTDSLLLRTRENLTGVRVIRAFRNEGSEKAAFADENNSLTVTQRRVGMISSLMNPLTYVIINLAILWLIEIGAIEVSHGTLTSGEVIALYNYMSQILVELIKLANLIISISKALASAHRISDVLALKSTEYTGTVSNNTGAVDIEFKNVSLTYREASEESLTDVSFTARGGETIGIIGSTGSGKSTLINLLAGFYPATDGEITINGININDYSREALRDIFGIVPQHAVLFRGTIRENLRLGNATATDEQISSALKIANATEIVEGKGGLDGEIEQGGRNLSGGQKQRLTIARALVTNPSVLILDDSASALDFATDASLRSSLRRELTDTTVFIVSQRASSIMHADKIIVLEDGEVLGLGTHSELIDSCPVYREIYESQFREGASVNG